MPTHSHCTSVTQSVRVNSERCYETLVFLNNRRRQLEVISLLTMTGPEVTWTGSHVDRKSRGQEVTWTGSHVDRKSRGQEVTWTGSHVDRKSRGPEVTWTGSHVDRKSRGQEVTWTGSHVDRKSRGPEVTWTGSHVDRKSRGQEVTWTGSHVDRKSRGPEVTWIGSHRCIEEADLCDFNNALIRGFGMLLQGSKFVVAIVANATMFLICYRDAHVVANICYCHNFLVLLI